MKTFYSINAFKKHYFPQAYYEEMKERAIKKLGYGLWLAKRHCAEIKAIGRKLEDR